MKLHTSVWGDPSSDKTALLIHGITSNAATWASVAQEMVKHGYFCIAPDLLGHGKSPKPETGYDLDNLVKLISNVVPNIPYILIGHSLGGLLGMLGTSDGVFDPRYLVLEDPTHVIESKEVPAKLLEELQHLPHTCEELIAINPGWDKRYAEERANALKSIDWEYMYKIFVDNAPWDYRRKLSEISGRVPTLYIIPHNSSWVSQEHIREVKRILGTDSVEVVGYDHNIHRQNLNDFLSTIFNWVAQLGGDN